MDYFLAYLSQFYEIVLFTSQPLYVGTRAKLSQYVRAPLFPSHLCIHNVDRSLTLLPGREPTLMPFADRSASGREIRPVPSVSAIQAIQGIDTYGRRQNCQSERLL